MPQEPLAAPTDRLRLLIDPPGDAAWNMAVDAALLAGRHPATLRFYGFEPAALTLGRFQDAAAFPELASRAVPCVRRMTGGGAILHVDELTYSLVGDAALLPTDVHASYDLVHDAIARGLAHCGVRAHRVTEHRPGPGPRALRAAHCFAVPARHDLVAPDGRKLCGSAQRRTLRPRARVLMHGSLPLLPRAAQPFVASVAELSVTPPDRAALIAALADALTGALGLGAAQPGTLAADEREHARAVLGQLRTDRDTLLGSSR